jgi:hypothetical protein
MLNLLHLYFSYRTSTAIAAVKASLPLKPLDTNVSWFIHSHTRPSRSEELAHSGKILESIPAPEIFYTEWQFTK